MAEGRDTIAEQGARTPTDAANLQVSKDAKTPAWAQRWLSHERLKPYLDDRGVVERALELYGWNFRLGQALLHDISCLEVALRNAYDRLMAKRWQDDAHWLLDDESPVRKPIMRKQRSSMLDANRVSRKIIDTASTRCLRASSPGLSCPGSRWASGCTSPTARARQSFGGRTSISLVQGARAGPSCSVNWTGCRASATAQPT